ncbi:T9SS type A sorting domain-containing protein [Formosa sp. S-31]|uniref:T9SS type A sorting domain-containing protein n=1 Tax=Formosa sp. S-31 TaxID=2790949 RepID=UPI003EC0B7BC
MTKNYLFLTILIFITGLKVFATDYYVSAINGNDANNGLSENTPFKTIQRAANLTNPGDTVYVMNGEYTSSWGDTHVVYVTRAGSASNWITYTNYPNHNPVIKFTGWGGFQVKDGAAYIKINGFIIQGNSDNLNLIDALNQPGGCNNPNGTITATYNGTGISMMGLNSWSTGYVHHIEITNNEVFDCPGGGIGANRSDYITIKNNKVYDNCRYNVYGNSGISLYQNWNYDSNSTTHRMIIENNYLRGNKGLVPVTFWGCAYLDGNGIIIDDSRNTQSGSTLGAYTGKTLIRNNVVIGNGGAGIHIFESDNIDIINNSTYCNQQTPEISTGEINAAQSSNVIVRNNIMYAKSDKPINISGYYSTNILFENNLLFGGNGNFVEGTNSIIANPNYINPTLDENTDLHINSTSPAIDSGSSILAPSNDFNGNQRPIGNGLDIGAYEYDTTLSIVDFKPLKIKIYPNPVDDIIIIIDLNKKLQSYKIYDLLGKIIVFRKGLKENKIDISELKSGIYLLELETELGETAVRKVYKK